MSLRHYQLCCPVCGLMIEDDGMRLECGAAHRPALLNTAYVEQHFQPEESTGLYRYRRWLPVVRMLPGASGTVTYRSAQLCRVTGLPNLWVAFNGYWPERGARLETATFKELEAYAVLSRLPERHDQVLVIASAGNTAAAFAWICSRNKLPCILVIPAVGLARMRFAEPLDACVRVVVLSGGADYTDAIALADRISRRAGCFSTGGVKNVARRDGLGTTMLNAAETIGRLPDYYFQAIGSGSGGVAVHEAAKRLVHDGRFGQTLPQLMLCQNKPFVPIYRSWKAQQREMIGLSAEEGRRQSEQILATVLSNQHPPYEIGGGVFDILTESGGDMFAADNMETRRAMALFEETEGIDIEPAAGVALAALLQAVEARRVSPEATILLHVSGGGWRCRWEAAQPVQAQPALTLERWEIETPQALDRMARLL